MSTWLPLAAAIVSEVSATLALRAAVDQPAWYALTVVGYLAAFGLLARTLEAGMPVGVAYAVWAATGVAATAVLAVPLFGESLSPTAGVGIALIVVGVVVVELGSHRATTRPTGAER
ncbi:DMT family transporter [Nocardioides sp. AX2bis]|uniref:DMT family transporter n=1 Tax=Nocardioides sp. AX2bis TaxID=2653157 RepID=UPI00135CCA72|nr:SMR family transporter [Nocardioides sp. AX2bis]